MVPIAVQTQQSSYMRGNQETPDPIDYLLKNPTEFIIMILAVVLLNIIIGYLTGGTGLAWSIIQTLDWVIVSFMVFEWYTTGFIGGYMDTALYEDDGLNGLAFRFVYHCILDWDGTIVRGVVFQDPFDFTRMRYFGEDV
jgi:hypothetical protein